MSNNLGTRRIWVAPTVQSVLLMTARAFWPISAMPMPSRRYSSVSLKSKEQRRQAPSNKHRPRNARQHPSRRIPAQRNDS